MKYKLVIFDLDGTLLNTLNDLASSVNFALKANRCPERSISEVRSFVGNGIRKLIERAMPQDAENTLTDKVFDYFKEHYALHCADTTCPYDGVTELLSKLRKCGCKTAVVSNKADFAVKDLCEKYFHGLLDCAVGERVGVPRKPAPDSVNEVLKTLSVNRNDAVYVGDSDVDVLTAKNSQMDLIAVDWGFRTREQLSEAGAENIVSMADEILSIIV